MCCLLKSKILYMLLQLADAILPCAFNLVVLYPCTYRSLLSCCSLYDQIFCPSKLSGNADFHLFKAGVEPKWEDPECANGGKWTVPCNRKATFENMWLETVHLCYIYLICSRSSICYQRLPEMFH